MTIEPITHESGLWNLVAAYAENCSWRAGPYLAQAMRENTFTAWERVFAAREGTCIEGFCTLAKTDCIPDVPYTPYIGFVFVGEPYRGKRLSQRLIQCALGYAKSTGFTKVYLVSGEQGLYEKYGFVKIKDAKDRWGRDEQIFTITV